jgi:hypothetical protein
MLEDVDHYNVYLDGRFEAEVVDPTCQHCEIEGEFAPGDRHEVTIESVATSNERSRPSEPLHFTIPMGAAGGNAATGKASDLIAQGSGNRERQQYVALFDYDPAAMSPNDDVSEELPLKEGQVWVALAQLCSCQSTRGPNNLWARTCR